MKNQRTHIRQRGVSIVELLVGVAIGLFIVGGATKLFVDNLNSNRRLLLDTRVNQDLRAAADIVVRDFRRAGYWDNSTAGLGSVKPGPPPEPVAGIPNPHTTGAGAIGVDTAASILTYSYALNNDNALTSNEYSGFKLEAKVNSSIGVLWMLQGQVWQPLTDPATLNVTAFSLTAANPAITNDLSKYCGCLKTLTCTLAVPNTWVNPPTLTIPRVSIVLTGNSVSDTSVTRTLRQTVRVRNAQLRGNCPA